MEKVEFAFNCSVINFVLEKRTLQHGVPRFGAEDGKVEVGDRERERLIKRIQDVIMQIHRLKVHIFFVLYRVHRYGLVLSHTRRTQNKRGLVQSVHVGLCACFVFF